MRDFGQLNLALAALLVAALWRPERYLVRTAALASLLFAVPHLAYHVANRDVYDTTDQVLNLGALGLAVVLPAVLVLGTAGPNWQPRVRSGALRAASAPTAAS